MPEVSSNLGNEHVSGISQQNQTNANGLKNIHYIFRKENFVPIFNNLAPLPQNMFQHLLLSVIKYMCYRMLAMLELN